MKANALQVLTLAVIAVGCGTGRSALAPTDMAPLSAAEVIQRVRENSMNSATGLRIEADLSIRAPAFTGAVRAMISHRRGDSLYASLTASALRIEAGRLWATPDSFFFHDRIKKQLVYGPSTLMSQFVPGILFGPHVFEQLLGILVPDPDASWSLEYTAGQYVLTRTDGGLRYIVDADHWRVTLREVRGPNDAVVEALRYGEFSDTAGSRYPGRVVFQRSAEGVAVTAGYRMITLDPDDLDFTIRVPAAVPRVRAEELLDPQEQP